MKQEYGFKTTEEMFGITAQPPNNCSRINEIQKILSISYKGAISELNRLLLI